MEEESSSEVNMVEGQLRWSAGRVLLPPAISKPLPLNSKRLKVACMKRIVASMSLPTSGSADNVRQMIEGRLTEMSKELQHVQVLVSRESGHIHLQLQDADGPFLDVEPEEEQTVSSTHDNDEQEEEQDLESALQESRELAAQLREEVSALMAQLERERGRVKEVIVVTSYESLMKPLKVRMRR